MKRLASLLIAVLLVMVACEKPPPPPPPEPPPPPPPSAEQLRGQARTNLANILNPTAPLPTDQTQQRINDLKSQLRPEVNGERALQLITRDVVDKLKEVRDNEMWDGVLVLCDALEMLDPTDVRLTRYREQARSEKNKPRVSVKGFFTDEQSGEINVFVDVVLADGKTESKTVREGEEFNDMKLVRIVGNQRGVDLLYMPTGQEIRVMR
jgi:hypothetical protein